MQDRDEERQVEGREGERPATEEEPDTEGHGLLTDPILAQQLSRSRAADLEREARERRRRNEIRPWPNRRG